MLINHDANIFLQPGTFACEALKDIGYFTAPNIARLREQEHLSFAPADVQELYLNFKYDGTKLSCTTGTSMNLFTLDKSLEQAWDKMAQRIFAKYEIPFEVE